MSRLCCGDTGADGADAAQNLGGKNALEVVLRGPGERILSALFEDAVISCGDSVEKLAGGGQVSKNESECG